MRKNIATMFALVLLTDGGLIDNPRYNVSIMNVSNAVLHDANGTYGSFESGGGILPPGIHKVYCLVPYPIPDVATVEWRAKDAVLHRKEVSLRRVPKDFRGEIRFEIDASDNVNVRLIPIAGSCWHRSKMELWQIGVICDL
jgi:hypothetical protein